MFGLNGKIARINLTTKKGSIENLKEDIIKKYLGGLGIALRIFYDEVPPEVQPLDPENKLIFMIGPLTSLVTSSTRHVIIGKSPLSGILGESYSGGYWSYELRKTGLDGIVIEGKAAEPVYIWIDNGQIEIKEAREIWELDTVDTQTKLKEILGDDKIRTACIGQAGINLVKYACIMNERNAAGRCGLGAVMGSKNLKAIAIRGKHNIKELVANKEEFKELAQEAIKNLSEHFYVKSIFGPVGTAGNMEVINHMGDVPHGYWKVGAWKHDKVFKGRRWKKMLAKHESCYNCRVRCKKVCELKDAEGNVLYYGDGPEYETVAGFGPLLLNDDFLTIFKANELCNRYGLDTISCSETIGWAMECWEKGILTEKEAEGLVLDWGNKDTILRLIERITLRQGIGNILAEGVDRAAKEIGKNSAEFAVTVKGVEVAHHDPRAFHSMALTYAISTHGANHNDAFTVLLSSLPRPELGLNERIPPDSNDPELNSKAVKMMQDFIAATNSLIMCSLIDGVFPPEFLLKIIKAITGLTFTQDELLTIGERIFNLKRMYGVRCGISKKDDTLPTRLAQEPLPDGGATGRVPDLEKMLVAYYKLRGWSGDGIPTDETIKRLELIVD
ncbi:MAG: aldehyde ferredoxin oxidoreductase family protein [Candidatus Helarchaeota archaeon]|nr:aldehyde ferredoxin oxidoreductase family protein [Candidatus Helarchaeota archaeon]